MKSYENTLNIILEMIQDLRSYSLDTSISQDKATRKKISKLVNKTVFNIGNITQSLEEDLANCDDEAAEEIINAAMDNSRAYYNEAIAGIRELTGLPLEVETVEETVNETETPVSNVDVLGDFASLDLLASSDEVLENTESKEDVIEEETAVVEETKEDERPEDLIDELFDDEDTINDCGSIPSMDEIQNDSNTSEETIKEEAAEPSIEDIIDDLLFEDLPEIIPEEIVQPELSEKNEVVEEEQLEEESVEEAISENNEEIVEEKVEEIDEAKEEEPVAETAVEEVSEESPKEEKIVFVDNTQKIKNNQKKDAIKTFSKNKDMIPDTLKKARELIKKIDYKKIIDDDKINKVRYTAKEIKDSAIRKLDEIDTSKTMDSIKLSGLTIASKTLDALQEILEDKEK